MKHVPLLLSLAALGLAIVALVRVQNGACLPGRGLDAYDLSSPQASWQAQMEIQARGDIRAMMELGRAQSEEVRRTSRLEEVVAIDDAQAVLFIAREEAGKRKFTTQGMRRAPGQELWLPDFISAYGLGKEHEDLAKKMRAWEGRGK